jgi:hypothetical protein
MKLLLVKSDGVFIGLDADSKAVLADFGEGEILEIDHKPETGRMTRTDQQNKALHLFFTMLADELNNKGCDVKVVVDKMKKGANVPWTKDSVKDILWRPFQRAMARVESTTELDKMLPGDIHQALMESLMEKLPVIDYVEFPDRNRMI